MLTLSLSERLKGCLDKLFKDFEAGKLKPFYKNREWSDLKGMPFPRRDLLGKHYSPFLKRSKQPGLSKPLRILLCSDHQWKALPDPSP